jgi:hypothetical protein
MFMGACNRSMFVISFNGNLLGFYLEKLFDFDIVLSQQGDGL